MVPLVKGQSKAEGNYLDTTTTYYRMDMLVWTITTYILLYLHILQTFEVSSTENTLR